MKKLKSIVAANLRNKKIVVRVDFNVTTVNGKIVDDTRIRETIPTLNYLLKNNNSLVILSHLGRPNGIDYKYGLKQVAKRLEKLLKLKIDFWDQFSREYKPDTNDKVVILENVRFNSGEELNNLDYAKYLASFGDVFVNDAFAVCHRAHSSTVGITKYLKSYAGLLLSKEINILSQVMHNPKRPVVSIIGGAKIVDKIGLIKKQLDHAQTVILGGGIANTFLKAKGIPLGKSLVEDSALEQARQLLYEAASKHTALLLPLDYTILNVDTNKIKQGDANEIDNNSAIMDIGPKTIDYYKSFLLSASTIIFNGPLGKYEEKPFGKGTEELIKATAESKALSVVGGGDTIAAIPSKQIGEQITHISTGGGAMLEYIEKGALPAIDVLY